MADDRREALTFHATSSEETAEEGPLSADDTRIAAIVQHSISRSGPLPDPDTLQRYEQVLPGLAERILVMAEKQSEHRQGLECAVVLSGIKAEGRGSAFAFTLGLAGSVSGALLAWHGQSLFGFATFVGSLGSLVTVFIIAQKINVKSVKKKTLLLTSKQAL